MSLIHAGWGDSGTMKAHDLAPSEKMSEGNKSGLISNEFQVEVRSERLAPSLAGLAPF
jgi:hypothetical protein